MELYAATHSSGVHQIRFIIETFFLPFLFFSFGSWASVLFNSTFLILLLFDDFIAFKCGLVTDQTIHAIIGTNKHELISMLQSGIYPVIFTFSVILVYLGRFFYKKGKFSSRRIVFYTLLLLLPIGNIAGVLVGLKGNERIKVSAIKKDTSSFVRRKMPGVFGDVEYGLIQLIYPPEGEFSHSPPFFHDQQDSSINAQHKGKLHNIIFVMGESSLASRYGVYGYKIQNTTPYLDAMASNKKNCIISHVHSAANLTDLSVPMTFSFFHPENPNLLLSEKNVIELARDNGYKTFWISSQDGAGSYSRTYGYISEFSDYVTRQDFNNQQNGVNWRDESLLPVIKEKFLDKNPYKFYVIHIMGSHESYADKRTAEDISALPNADEYDQSIHRTDRILHQIIDMADHELGDYTLVYTSDHGEVVGMGHGLQYGGYDQYNIPMIVRDPTGEYCRYVEKLRNVDGYYSSLMNKYLILDMLGYDIDPKVIEEARHTDPILHSDDKVYNYKNIPTLK